MTTRWTLFVEHLPDMDGQRKTTMGHQVFDTEAEALAEKDRQRRQNLPFRSWPVSFEDPRP